MKPVWDGYFADPFVLQTRSGYFAFGTDGPDQQFLHRTGRAIPVLHSQDLLSWEPLEGALSPPTGVPAEHFWAPEVIEWNGSFYLFYSCGGAEGEHQRLRVAKSSQPEGPYEDSGRFLLPDESFSIDASPFLDSQTGWLWLFFAKDFLDGERPGTGLAQVRLGELPTETLGPPRTVLRPWADWQLFERHRFWYGRTWRAWYTVEGPFCVYRLGKYWLFFSGGLWKTEDYGLGVAVCDSVNGNFEPCDGDRLLKSERNLRGPGHNTVVTGPDGLDRLVFHAWDEDYTRRQMYIEPLEWTPSGPKLTTSS